MLYNGYHYPKGEEHVAKAIEYEWQQKQQFIYNLTKGKGTVVQAGANCGYFPIKLAEQYENVITFEPIPEIHKLAKKNIKKHKADNVTLYQMGLGTEATFASVSFTEENNSGATGLANDEDGKIELMSIDNLYLDDCSLIWLDIEGFEAEALAGAINTIDRCRPIIVLENKGLIPGFSDLQFRPLGDSNFRRWVENKFHYTRTKRIMRDDIFVPE